MKDTSSLERLKSMCENRDIQSLYDKMMDGYSIEGVFPPSISSEDGYYHKLYAPGYEENGVAEVVAKCI